MSTLTAKQAKIIAELSDVLAKVADLNARAETLKNELRDSAEGDIIGPDGEPVARVTPARALNVDKAFALVPEALREQCYTEPVVDPAKVKQFLAPALLETCMEPKGKARVTLL